MNSRVEVDENNMNCAEGHLGGYIRSSAERAVSGLDITHGDPMTWYPALWRWSVSALNVRSMLDIGCGEGHSAAFFQGMGCEVLGIDGSIQASRDSRIPGRQVIHDFTRGPYDPGRDFDMVWCCEFVEHVASEYVENFLQTFRSASRFVLMTHALPGQVGWHHVNCREPDYWIDHLRQAGFTVNRNLTAVARGLVPAGYFAETGLVLQRITGDTA